MTAIAVAGRFEVTGPPSFALPQPDGWSLAERSDTPLALTGPERAVLHVTTAPCSAGLDPRGVGARLAQRLQQTAPGAVVEHRHFGWFGERLVALQLLRAGSTVHLHAVFVEGAAPAHVFVVSAAGDDEEFLGRSLVAAATGIVVQP